MSKTPELLNYFSGNDHSSDRKKQLNYLASELLDQLGYSEMDEITEVLERCFHSCISARVAIDDHFERIYLHEAMGLVIDWKLSSLACYLLAINGDPANPNVGRAQLFFISKMQDV